jgi:hypothetical protein
MALNYVCMVVELGYRRASNVTGTPILCLAEVIMARGTSIPESTGLGQAGVHSFPEQSFLKSFIFQGTSNGWIWTVVPPKYPRTGIWRRMNIKTWKNPFPPTFRLYCIKMAIADAAVWELQHRFELLLLAHNTTAMPIEHSTVLCFATIQQ